MKGFALLIKKNSLEKEEIVDPFASKKTHLCFVC